jgi:hypothetical protein
VFPAERNRGEIARAKTIGLLSVGPERTGQHRPVASGARCRDLR